MNANAFLQLLLWITLAVPAAAIAGSHEPIDPEKAFRLSARAVDARTVAVEFEIAGGYYMYRDRFKFAGASGAPIGGARIPSGTIKQDQFFGRTEVFREMVSIWLPVSPDNRHGDEVRLKVTSQGCWDGGVCYAPQEQFVNVSLSGLADGDMRKKTAVSPAQWPLAAAALLAGLALGWVSAGCPASLRAIVGRTRTHLWRAVLALLLGACAAALAWISAAFGRNFATPWIAGFCAFVLSASALLWFGRSRPSLWQAASAPELRTALHVSVLVLAWQLADPAIAAALALGVGLGGSPAEKRPRGVARALAIRAVAIAMAGAAVWVAAPYIPDLPLPFDALKGAAALVLKGHPS